MADKEERFTSNSWAGRPNHRCSTCPFETTDLAAIRKHVDQAHTFDTMMKQAEVAKAAESPRGSGGSSAEEADK